MAATNTYTINGEMDQIIELGSANIDMSEEAGVKAGCKEYPVPLLNRITVKSVDRTLSASKTIFAGYKIVNQMLGALNPTGSNYSLDDPLLSTIVLNGKFGIFEPAIFVSAGIKWSTYDLKTEAIESLLNIGTGIKICVKVEYAKSNGSPATAYIPISGPTSRFAKITETTVPRYSQIGNTALTQPETVDSTNIINADKRSWFESVLNRDDFNVDLSLYITDPDATKNIVVTLMAYIGSAPTADNTFLINPMNSGTKTRIVVSFDTFNPTINIVNKDTVNNPDNYADGYGSVADYLAGDNVDTTINIDIQ